MTNFNKQLFFLLTIIIIIMSFTNNNNYNNNNIEPFIPRKIKEFYRPITRNIRQKYENFYGKTSTKILNVCKKIGIL